MTTATPTAAARRPAFDAFGPVWRILTSVRFAVLYIATLAAFGLTGVLIPQVPEAMRGNDAAIQTWLDTQRGTFGPATDTMYRFGLFEVFHARWFLFALAFLVVNVTTCTFNRWSPTFRNVFHPPVRVPDRFYERAHNRTELAPVAPAALESALRGLRFKTQTDVRDGATYVFADRHPWTQLATFVSHLALILFISGGLVTWLTGFSTDIFAGEGTTTPVFAVKDPNQLQVRIDQATGVFGDQGNALDFRTHLTIFKNGEQVASGVTTVNDPMKYGGYRFHQAAFFKDGAELHMRDLATGNVIFDETFPLDQTTAAPAVTITDSAGNVLLDDVIAPTDFLSTASGALVQVPAAGGDPARVLWVGIQAKDDKAWQVLAFDPQAAASSAGPADAQLRIDEGATGAISGLNVTFNRVAAIPSAVGVNLPGSSDTTLAQMATAKDGGDTLMLVSKDHPAISLAPGQSAQVGGYEYTFDGRRQFAGISVKRDSGAWFIWAATAMLVGGLAITFYVPRRRLWIRLTRERTQVAALAEKSGGFEKDMRILATRLHVAIPPELEEER
jgi:cytochrome c biogenesis protein